MLYEKTIITTTILALLINAAFNGYYFFAVSSFWRWIKLMYVFNSILGAGFLYASTLRRVCNEPLLFAVLLLTMTMVGGTIVSIAKIRIGRVAEKQIDQIIQRANGHTET